MKKIIVSAFCAMLATFALADGGKTYKSASGLKASQTATLVEDEDGYGVAWFKATLAKGYSYTVWIQGADADEFTLESDSDPTWEKEDTPFADFEDGDAPNGYQVLYMYSDSWDEEDPKSWTYYFCVSGEVGEKITLGFASGIKSFRAVGEEDNPAKITFGDNLATTKETSLLDLDTGYEYYFRGSVKAGFKYYVATELGTTNAPLSILIDPELEHDEEEIVSEGNDSYYVYPNANGDLKFSVSGVAASKFKLRYMRIPGRAIDKHVAPELDPANALFRPNRRIAAETGFYDNVIDECLRKVKVVKGDSYVFDAIGADREVTMEVYDDGGNVLGSNSSVGDGTHSVRVVVTAAASGWMYVGVCDPSQGEYAQEPLCSEVALSCRNVKDIAPADSFDPGDDTREGATPISPLPATASSDPVTEGAFCGEHAFNGGDWHDVYCIGGRKNVTYVLKTVQTDDSVNDLELETTVFTWNASKKKEVEVATEGDIDKEGLSFDATANAQYFIRVSVKGGIGLDYPPHAVYACAYSKSGSDLGILKVNTPGAPGATWWITSDGTDRTATKYGDGVSILVAGKQTVNFTGVTGFKTPAAIKDVEVLPGTVETVRDGRYVDSADPADNGKSGAVVLKPAAKDAMAKRTLWSDDPADYFSFVAAAGKYYNFKVVDTTGRDLFGDAVFTVSDAAGNVIAESVTEYEKQTFPAGTYFLKVAHAVTNAPAESVYSLAYSGLNVGQIRFDKQAYSFKENATYAELKLKRTAKEGVVRVRYMTQEGTAKPGVDYYPDDGEVTWASGDGADKVIRIRLIPDEIAKWEGGSKAFGVRIQPVDPDDLATDEYLASISGTNMVQVTLTEVSKMAPGSVTVTAVNGVRQTNVKKPAGSVKAGEAVSLTVERLSGADGKIAVGWETVKGKAIAGTDFTPASGELVWEDGESAAKTISVQTLSAKSLDPSRAFTVKFTVKRGTGLQKPSLAASSAAIAVNSDKVAKGASAYAKSIPASSGVKLAAKGAWYLSVGGDYRVDDVPEGGVVETTFTLTGPGLFVANPQFEGGSLKYTLGKNSAVECTAGRQTIFVPSGSQALKFTYVGPGSLSFGADEVGAPYKWVSLKSLVHEPATKAVVFAGEPGDEDAIKLGWNAPVDADLIAGIRYRIRFGTDAKSLPVLGYVAGTANSFDHTALQEGKTYYWALDFAYTNTMDEVEVEQLRWATGETWNFATSVKGAVVTAISGADAYGNALTGESGETVRLVQGVEANFALSDNEGDPVSGASVVAGKLPDGVKLKKVSGTKYSLAGVPTKTGNFAAVVQLKNAKGGETVALRFTVEPASTAVGNFYGVTDEGGSQLDSNFPTAASVTLTSATSGKLTAKVLCGGKTYSFKAGGFECISEETETCFERYHEAEMSLVQKVAGVTCTNRLWVSVGDQPSDAAAALVTAAGSFRLTLCLPAADGKAVIEDVVYEGVLYRDNVKSADYLAEVAAFAGYYTIALSPLGADPSAPSGNGYLTLTVDAKAKVKVAGMLANGDKVSLSAVARIVADPVNPQGRQMIVPIYFVKKPSVLVGNLRINRRVDEAGVVSLTADPASGFVWATDSKTATRDNVGFRMDVMPAGGFWDKVVNLQAHYLDCDFSVDASDWDSLPEEAAAKGYELLAETSPDGLAVAVNGNALSVAKRKLVKEAGSKLYDFGASVNPANVTIKFVRATGLVSGTVSAWSGNGTAQKEISKIKHYGVALGDRDEDSLLAPEIWSAGFFLSPSVTLKNEDTGKTFKWAASLPFNIKAEYVDRDWSEAEPIPME